MSASCESVEWKAGGLGIPLPAAMAHIAGTKRLPHNHINDGSAAGANLTPGSLHSQPLCKEFPSEVHSEGLKNYCYAELP